MTQRNAAGSISYVSIAEPFARARAMAGRRPFLKGLVTGLAAIAWVHGVSAQPAKYPAHPIKIVVPFAAGGPTDIESRIFAKHLTKHIPGQPTVVVQAMGGAGGLTAVNYIGEVAKPDGLTAAYFTGSLFQHQIKDPALRVDISKFGFIRLAVLCGWGAIVLVAVCAFTMRRKKNRGAALY